MSSDEKFQPFKAGDWRTRRPAAASQNESKDDEDVKFERTYPLFRHFLTTENFTPLFQRCERSCTELDRVIRTGNNEIAQEAQHALNAFGRSMQLATEL